MMMARTSRTSASIRPQIALVVAAQYPSLPRIEQLLG
jgi:hypothetical protein